MSADHPNIDLHSHTTRSDGTLSPTALVERARANGVDMLALTDHDVLDGLPEAQAAARAEALWLAVFGRRLARLSPEEQAAFLRILRKLTEVEDA